MAMANMNLIGVFVTKLWPVQALACGGGGATKTIITPKFSNFGDIINYNMYILIMLLSLWTVFITSHHGLHRYSSHATSDSSPTTTVFVTPPRSFQLSILVKQCREYNNYGHISSQICSSVYKKYAYVLPESVDHDLYELSLIGV